MIKHCEGDDTSQLYFVHRSIYQYFVAETIYSSIKYASETVTDETQKILAKDIVQYLKMGKIDTTIGDFLKQKVLKLYLKFGKEKQQEFYEWLDNSICKMINVGMFYYTNINISEYENILKKELTCFENLIKILHMFLFLSDKDFYLQNANSEMLRRYIVLLSSKAITDCINLADLLPLSLQHFSVKYDNRFELDRMYLKGMNLENVVCPLSFFFKNQSPSHYFY